MSSPEPSVSSTLTAAEVRQQFIDYFTDRTRGHTFVPSSPVVPHDDPTLLFTNAGMNQFKPIFLGQESRDYSRAVNSQKCIRAGGKHNDLEDVGKDTYHHTYFEMLGNWSFGDYFKAEAIEWAWDLLTNVWGIDPQRLHATYFEGDASEGLEPDDEARDLWLRYLPKERVHTGNKKDNFWEMGDTGPCGPCSEIHYDNTPGKDGASLVNAGDPRVIEIWNLVFIQFNRAAGGKLSPLPAKHVDTGMGFERILRVLQGKDSNYDTDLWTPIFKAIESHTGAHPYQGTLDDHVDIAYRVLADHIRCLTMAITDGAEFSPKGRGSVLRSIARRAIRHARQTLKTEGAWLYTLVPVVIDSLGDAFPELKKDPKRVANVIHREELAFLDKIESGTDLLDEAEFDSIVRATKRRYPSLDHLEVIEKFGLAFAKVIGGQLVSYGGPRHAVNLADGEDHGRPELNNKFTVESADGRVLQVPPFPQGVSIDFRSLFQVLEISVRPFENVAQRSGIATAGAETTGPTHAKIELKSDEKGNVEAKQVGVVISAEDAFKLHDTYGFPIDLTRVMAEERGMTVDVEGFERLMEEARERSRAGTPGSEETIDLPADALGRLKHMGVKPTDDSAKFDRKSITAQVEAIWNGTDFDNHTYVGDRAALILNRTNLYAEAGGQVGDHGEITEDGDAGSLPVRGFTGSAGQEASLFKVDQVRAAGGYVLHIGHLADGKLSVGDRVVVTVEQKHRQPTQANHTATHLLNFALREVLGESVQQKGSLVAPDRLRFDFSHHQAMTQHEISEVQRIVSEQIEEELAVDAMPAPLEQAKRIRGVRAVFGEKYPDPVRVVAIGVPVRDLLADPENEKWMEYSIEFCGGTHLKKTNEAQRFVILHEGALASGVRRIVAITGVAAQAANVAGMELLERVEAAAKLGDDQLPGEADEIARLIDDLTIGAVVKHQVQAKLEALRETAKSIRKKAQKAGREWAVQQAREIAARDDTTIIVEEIQAGERDVLLAAMDTVRDRRPKSAVMLLTPDVTGEKVIIVSAVPDELIKRGLKAGDWVRIAAQACDGSGGGKPDRAQAGGKDPSKIGAAIEAARHFADEKLA